MVEPDHFLEAALLEAATEAGSGLTPAAFKSLSKSVADLSTLSPDLMKSTGDLMTGRVASRMFKRKMGQIKSSSQQSLIPGSAASSVDDLPSSFAPHSKLGIWKKSLCSFAAVLARGHLSPASC